MDELEATLEQIRKEKRMNNAPLTEVRGVSFEQDLEAIRNRNRELDQNEASRSGELSGVGKDYLKYVAEPFRWLGKAADWVAPKLGLKNVPDYVAARLEEEGVNLHPNEPNLLYQLADGIENNGVRYFADASMGIADTVVRGYPNAFAILARIAGAKDVPNSINDFDEWYSQRSEEARRRLIGDNPTFADNMWNGSGTSLGHSLPYLLAMGAAYAANPSLTLPVWVDAALYFFSKLGSEALTEAGNTASEVYRTDKTRTDDVKWAGLYSFLTNAPLDAVTGLASTGLEGLMKSKLPWLSPIIRRGSTELFEEETQEPRQQAVETAIKNTFASGDMSFSNYWRNLKTEFRKLPEYSKQVAAETAASTIITTILLSPFGLGGGDANINTLTDEQKAQQYDELTKAREGLQPEIDTVHAKIDEIRQQASEDGDQAEKLKDLEKQASTLEKIANAYDKSLANFWGGTNVTTNPVQDEYMDFFPDKDELAATPVPAPAMMPETENVEPSMTTPETLQHSEAQQVSGLPDLLPEERQIMIPDNEPMSGRQVDESQSATTHAMTTENDPSVNVLGALGRNDFGEENRNDVQEEPQLSGVLNSRRGDYPAGNTARVRTIKGTEADIRYRIVDADSLTVSTNETGVPNPEYPQELQPRQRNREASIEQVIKMSGSIDPELLGENRLASDGAPIIGNDNVVESGNGRVMALRRAYKLGTAENYRSWLKDNASRFGINPDEIDTIRKPVLVRERISDVDRVKFTQEANESSTARMSMTETAMNDASKITPEMLSSYDPDKPLQGNHAFIQSFSRIIPGSERGDFIQQNGAISKSGLTRMRNALMAKAYNDTGILNRLNEIYDDDIKNVSNALIQAAPRIAAFENGGYSPEISIRGDIIQAVRTLARLKEDGEGVSDFLGQGKMFRDADISDEAKMLLQFFDRNKRSAKRIAKGLSYYAESAANEAKQGQNLLFEDSARDKATILREAIRVAEAREDETYSQKNTAQDIDNGADVITGLLGKVGLLDKESSSNVQEETQASDIGASEPTLNITYTDSDNKEHTLTARTREFSDKHPNQKKYFGRYVEFTDENGKIVARYSPYTEVLQTADGVQDADSIRKAIAQNFNTQLGRMSAIKNLQKLGYLDERGKLISDSNEEYRSQYRARLDTNQEGATYHPSNLDTPTQTRADARTPKQRKADDKAQRVARKRVRNDIAKKLRQVWSDYLQYRRKKRHGYYRTKGIYRAAIDIRKYKGKPIRASLASVRRAFSWIMSTLGEISDDTNLPRLYMSFKPYAKTAAELASGALDGLAAAYGMPVDELYRDGMELEIVFDKDLNEGREPEEESRGEEPEEKSRGEIRVNPPHYDEKDNFHKGQLIIAISPLFNESTTPHEFGHTFLREYGIAVATVPDLPQHVKDTWHKLAKWLGISDIDPMASKDERIARGQDERYKNGQEKFAVALEQYLYEGKTPSRWFKKVFKQFKTWMSHVYPAINNIKYEGSDRQMHSVELSPEVREMFDTLFGFRDMPYVPSEANRQARLALSREVRQGSQSEEFHRQSVTGQEGRHDYSSDEKQKIARNLQLGNEAMNKVISEHTDVVNAMFRDDLGSISFLWGEKGTGNKLKHGWGIAHLIARRNQQGYNGEAIARKMVDVIARGTITRRYGQNVPNGERVDINHDGHTAILSLYRDGNKFTWLLTGFKDEIPGASGEGNGSTSATLNEPMRTRLNEGAGNSAQSLSHNISTVNSTSTKPSRIGRSNSTFISQEDIERFEQLVLHGTGHVILNNRFGLEYINSGEGHQSFGWGLYFAQHPLVAEHYRRYGIPQHKNGGFSASTNDGKTFSQVLDDAGYLVWDGNPDSITESVLNDIAKAASADTKLTYEQISASLLDKYENERKQPFADWAKIRDKINALNNITSFSQKPKSNGNIYLADIPEDYLLIDYYASLDEQSDHVQKAIDKVISKLYDIGAYDEDIDRVAQSQSGEEFYLNLRDALEPFIEDGSLPFKFDGKAITRSDMAASLLLNQAGIPGMRYWDEASRYEQEGTTNFVIWNTDMIELLGLTEDSDEEAKQYFRDAEREGQQKSSETYRQTARNEDAETWSDIVDSFMRGEISRGRDGNLLHVMDTPEVFTLVGMERLPVEIHSSNMNKILFKKHRISPETLKQIPQALADPVMIFRSQHDASKGRDSRVILTELTEHDASGKERRIMAAITLGKSNLSKGYAINELTTVYRKDTSSKQQLTPEEDIYDWITRTFKDGSPMNLLLYVNKQKARQGAMSPGIQPLVFDILDKLPDSIPDERDLANLKRQAMQDSGHEVSSQLTRTANSSSETYHQSVMRETGGNAMTAEEIMLTPGAKVQYDEVVSKYKGTSQWMKAPNGKPTNLTERQWVLVRTDNFKYWFGDWENDPQNASKVVDENGEPLVVYHGTDNPGFSIFNTKGTGSYFSSNKLTGESYSFRGSVYPVFLNLRNPYIHDANGSIWDALLINGSYIDTNNLAVSVRNGNIGSGNHDGVIVRNVIDVESGSNEQYDPETGKILYLDDDEVAEKFIGDDFIVFNPPAIKSATRNNGMFSPSDGDVYKQDAGGFATSETMERFEQLVLHGTGHVILDNKFDLKYLGTGEGSQVFGYGLYFAESPEVAATYRRLGLKYGGMGKMTVRDVDGREYTSTEPGVWIDKDGNIVDDKELNIVLKDFQDWSMLKPDFSYLDIYDFLLQQYREEVQDSKKLMRNKKNADAGRTELARNQRKLDWLHTIKDFTHTGRKQGNVYNVDIPENFELLDWDAKISEQSEQVKRNITRMAKALVDRGYIEHESWLFMKPEVAIFKGIKLDSQSSGDITGGALYQNVYDILAGKEPGYHSSNFFGDKDAIRRVKEKTSALFDEFGIPGHRFFDKFSRKAKSGTHNFVIWNTSRLKIAGVEGDTEAVDYFRDTALRKLTEKTNETYRQIIGTRGARELDKAEGVTTRMDNLRIARRMERKGLPVKNMWLATGWMRGADGKWRYELMDGKIIRGKLDELRKNLHELDELDKILEPFAIKNPNLQLEDVFTPEQVKRYHELENLTDIHLPDIFTAPELFKAYPELRNIIVWIDNNLDASAMFYPDIDAIAIGGSDDNFSVPRELRKNIIHEIQHAIQMREGFAGGSNYSLKKDTAYKGLIKKFQSMIKRLDGVTRNKILDILNAEFNGDNSQAQSLTDALSETELDSLRKINDVLNKAHERNDYLFSKYQRHAGETEARNAETRAYWSEARRKRTTLDASEDTPRSEQIIGRISPRVSSRLEQNETYRQPLNDDVDLDSKVQIVKITDSLPDVPFYMRIKAFGKSRQEQIISRFKNGAVVNKHTGLTITLSRQGLNHILDTARNTIDTAGSVIYQSVPYLDSLARNAYRVETHGDMKPSATKIEGQKGNLKQVHRFLAPVELNGDIYILKLTAKEYDSGEAEIDEVSLYDMKYTKKLSAHPSQNSPNLMGRAAGTIGNADAVSVRDMLEGVNDASGNPYSASNGDVYKQIAGYGVATRLDQLNGNHNLNGFVSQADIERFNQANIYHGTGHVIFDNRFDLRYIGSGEGHQAFGYGIYLAENLNVAENYRLEGLSQADIAGNVTITLENGKSYSYFDRYNYTRDIAEALYRLECIFKMNPDATNQEGLSYVEEGLKLKISDREKFGENADDKTKAELKDYRDILRVIRSIKDISYSAPRRGNIYNTTIPDNYELLDWDKKT